MGNITFDLDSPDPAMAINAFLHCMNAQRRLRLMPRTEHMLIEHLMREDVSVLYYSSASTTLSIIEGKDADPMEWEDSFEIIKLISQVKRRQRLASKDKSGHREAVADDFGLAARQQEPIA